MVKGKRTSRLFLFLLLFCTPLFSARDSAYYKNRLRYSPHFIYYQRKYILSLISEKRTDTASRWLDIYSRSEREKGRSILLRGILLAASGHLRRARKIWRKWWPYGSRKHFYLEREYRQYKLHADLLGFYSYLSGRFPGRTVFSKRVCIYSIYGTSPDKFQLNIVSLLRKRLTSPLSLARSLYPYLCINPGKSAFLNILRRKGTVAVFVLLKIRHGEPGKAGEELVAALRSGRIALKKGLSLIRYFRILKDKRPYFRVIRFFPEKRLSAGDRLLLAQSLESKQPFRAERIYLALSVRTGALRGLSRIYLSRKKFGRALFFQKRIDNPRQEDWRLRGILHCLSGDLRGALQDFRNLYPEDRALCSALALLATGKKREEIIGVLRQGLRNPGGDGKALPALRLLYHLKYIRLKSAERKLASEAVRSW